MSIVSVNDIVEANGKTVRENNLEQPHTIPLGALVDLDWDFGENKSNFSRTIRAYVAAYARDCDGEPLYLLTISERVLVEAEAVFTAKHILVDKAYKSGKDSEEELDYHALTRWADMTCSSIDGPVGADSLVVVDRNEGFLEYLREQYGYNYDDHLNFLLNIRRRM